MKVRNSIRSVKNQPGSQVVRRRGRTVTLTLSARGIKTVDQRGVDAVVADILAHVQFREER
ncbi:hypothetical protein GCM10009641_30170 [Mycobacterium cookii]|uniref:Uncharacterized protein n=1 Tax=Nocardioides furvisabuli TaxID=375542 RepID=A0ABP5J8R7_9ACTN